MSSNHICTYIKLLQHLRRNQYNIKVFQAFSFQNNMESTELEPQSTSIFDLNYVLNGCSNLSPDIEEDERAASPTVNMLNVNYEVTEWIGPWWKGACFRRQRKKTVLRDITVQLKSGLLTAILGNSGDMLCLNFESGLTSTFNRFDHLI